MPYIEESRRTAAMTCPGNVGELTFKIQQVLKGYLTRKGECYQHYADCLAALDGARLDLWDRRIQDYEHGKRDRNGDVW